MDVICKGHVRLSLRTVFVLTDRLYAQQPLQEIGMGLTMASTLVLLAHRTNFVVY